MQISFTSRDGSSFRSESDLGRADCGSYLRSHRSSGRRASDDRGPGSLGTRICQVGRCIRKLPHGGQPTLRCVWRASCARWVARLCFRGASGQPVEPIFDILDEFDMILIMTVEPGFGGQKFLDNQMAKVRRLRDEITRRASPPRFRSMAVSARRPRTFVAEAGADVLVAGSAVYGAEDLRKPLIPSVRRLKPHSRPEPTNISRIDTNNEDFLNPSLLN